MMIKDNKNTLKLDKHKVFCYDKGGDNMVSKQSRWWDITRIGFYLVLYGAFMAIPLEVVLQGSLCFTYTHFHIVCPACGITRAFSCLMHGQWILAYRYHPLFTLCIAPICTFLFTQDTYTVITRITKKGMTRSILEFLFRGLERWTWPWSPLSYFGLVWERYIWLITRKRVWKVPLSSSSSSILSVSWFGVSCATSICLFGLNYTNNIKKWQLISCHFLLSAWFWFEI